MDNWAGIDAFVAVAQLRSFTLAARRLGRSTSHLSREVAALEDRLGHRLFQRTTRQVSLTEGGEMFLQRCRRLQEERDEAFAALQAQGDDLQGQLRLTCSVAYGERFVAPIVDRLLLESPKLSVDMILTDAVLDLVQDGIDLAVRFGRLRDSRLVVSRLASRTWLLCASPAYVERFGQPGDLEELSQHTCLRGNAESWTFARAGQAFVHRPQGRYHCNSGQAVLGAALAGLGLCQLPDFYVRTHLARGELLEVLPRHRPPDEGVWAVYPHRRHLPTKVRVLVERLQAGLAGVAP